MGESLDYHSKELILDSHIIDKHELGKVTLPYRYNPKLWHTHIHHNRYLDHSKKIVTV